jgi:hypothetical protein
MSQKNSISNEVIRKTKKTKKPMIKSEGKKKKTKNNYYNSSFRLGIPEDSSKDEDDTTPIKIFYKEKIATININTSEPFSELIEQIKAKFKIEKFEEKFEIFFDRKQIPLTDGRTISEIIGTKEEDEYVLFELREKFIKNLDIKDKLYIELENVPSFMDLTSQITDFIETQSKDVDYELNYKNNVYMLLFSSNQIGFSFITFMSKLKFSNKYYRKLRIKIHFKMVDKIRYELDINKEKDENKINEQDKGFNLIHKSKNNKSKSSGNLFRNNKNIQNRYLRNNNNFINNYIPYEQEKLMKRIENAKNKTKWMNYKGFFTSANIQSFNSIISPRFKIPKVKIKQTKEKKSKRIFLNDININEEE